MVAEAAALTLILILTLMMGEAVMAGEQIVAGTRECQPLQQRNCPGSRPRESRGSFAAISLLPPCSHCHLESFSKFPRRSVAGSARRFFPVFHRLMILLLESSGAVCKIPVS